MTATKLPQETRDTYDTLRAALLERDDSHMKNVVASFWTITKRKGVTALEFGQQIDRLVDRFLDGEDRASCKDSIVSGNDSYTSYPRRAGSMLDRGDPSPCWRRQH